MFAFIFYIHVARYSYKSTIAEKILDKVKKSDENEKE